MDQELLALIAQWDGNGVVVRHDRPTGAWIFVALHSSALGRPTGGTRMKIYPKLSDALLDAMRLAEGMTHKWAGINVGYGGGKAVLAIPRPLEGHEKEGLLERYGAFLESLLGAFATGPDLGVDPEAMAVVARRTQYVLGVEKDGVAVDPGPFTALGVKGGIHAALGQVFGRRDVAGRMILVEGIGGVGLPLARSLAEEGATLILSDLNQGKADQLAHELGVETVRPADVPSVPCDVYAPCAVGATLNVKTIPRLQCKVVAGSANNQLAEDQDADRLAERGILYVPDYILNAGGAMALCLMEEGLEGNAVRERVAAIEDSVVALLDQAAATGNTPLAAARRRVDEILSSSTP